MPLLKLSHPDSNLPSSAVRLDATVASKGLLRPTLRSDGLTRIVSLPMDSPRVTSKRQKHSSVSNVLDTGELSSIQSSFQPKRNAGRQFRELSPGARRTSSGLKNHHIPRKCIQILPNSSRHPWPFVIRHAKSRMVTHSLLSFRRPPLDRERAYSLRT